MSAQTQKNVFRWISAEFNLKLNFRCSVCIEVPRSLLSLESLSAVFKHLGKIIEEWSSESWKVRDWGQELRCWSGRGLAAGMCQRKFLGTQFFKVPVYNRLLNVKVPVATFNMKHAIIDIDSIRIVNLPFDVCKSLLFFNMNTQFGERIRSLSCGNKIMKGFRQGKTTNYWVLMWCVIQLFAPYL